MAIRIVYYSEPIDNWGRSESSAKGKILHEVLTKAEEWSDDMEFEDNTGKKYSIEDLAGKEVYVPEIGFFTVPTGKEIY